MANRILGAFLLLLVLFAALVTVAVKLGGLWGLAGGVLLFLLGARLLRARIGALVENLLTAPFRAKGAVLKDAAVEVHSVTAIPPPDPADPGPAEPAEAESPEARESGPCDWYLLVVTVTPPAAAAGAFTLWEPGELLLATADTRADLDPDGPPAAEIAELEIWRDGDWAPEEGGKYSGPQRLRIRAGVPRGWRRVRFRYYLELLGDVALSIDRDG